MNTTSLFSVLEKLAIDVLLRKTSFEEHTLAVPPDERKVTVSDLNLVALLEQGSVPDDAQSNCRRNETCDR